MTPVEVTATYRFPHGRLVPYAGGVGWHRYDSTTPVADPGEDPHETFRGYHVLTGAEVRIAGWLGIAGEAQWTRVPNALAGPVAELFGETGLGGGTLRLRVVIGR